MNFLYGVIIYISLALIWAMIVLVAYALSLAIKKPVVIFVLATASQIISQIILFLLSLYFGFSILFSFFHNFIVVVILAVIFGSFIFGLLSMLLNILAFPFTAIPMYFVGRIEKDTQEDNIETAEILDGKGKVIGKTVEGSGVVNRKLSIYFLIDYVLIELYIYLHRTLPQYRGWKWGDYVTEPLFWIGSELVVFGFFIILFYLIRYKKFFPFGKRKLLLKVIKIDVVLTGILTFLSFL